MHLELCRNPGRSACPGAFGGSAPMVGTVLSTSPMCSLYRIVVLPAASRPNMTTCSCAGRSECRRRAQDRRAYGRRAKGYSDMRCDPPACLVCPTSCQRAYGMRFPSRQLVEVLGLEPVRDLGSWRYVLRVGCLQDSSPSAGLVKDAARLCPAESWLLRITATSERNSRESQSEEDAGHHELHSPQSGKLRV